MEPARGFRRFNDLPKELRILIWEYHFQAHRIHVVHPAPESEKINPMKEVLVYSCTILDPATNLIIEDRRPPSPLVNREALEVFLWCKRVWTPITFNKDLAESVTANRGRVPPQFVHLAGKRDIPKVQERPVYIDWSRDILYICASHTEQTFWSLRSTPWRNEVRKLALLIPHVGFAGAIPFGPSAPIREVLDYMHGVEELFIVLIPQAGTAQSATAQSATAREAIARLPRDVHGFVPYVNYLKEAGLAKNHMLYNRTAMLIRDAMASAPRKIKIERVVDVDYITTPFGYYERKPRSPFATTVTRHLVSPSKKELALD
ncbi:uncharacterized protein F4807DRAFT_459625 [Annulohypoxylon truncatum]|uniref:uncharacterized protein n=1 Tax=Annulohypoxylon truncatum TaxID=327061 RepID=UPI00200891AB|nr:uncharacterized protein F4807DRAFT_459625 [Annulohypoxylon truncatum]KAI1210785.1 hypothetical protein F4807DRAFT_459625 [Annulohypoxylon truncatum]